MGKKKSDCVSCKNHLWTPTAEQKLYLRLMVNMTMDNIYSKGHKSMKDYINIMKKALKFMEADCG